MAITHNSIGDNRISRWLDFIGVFFWRGGGRDMPKISKTITFNPLNCFLVELVHILVGPVISLKMI